MIFSAGFGCSALSSGSGSFHEELDSNRDRSISLSDFASFRSSFGGIRQTAALLHAIVDIQLHQGEVSEHDGNAAMIIRLSAASVYAQTVSVNGASNGTR